MSKIPQATAQYDPVNERQARAIIETAIGKLRSGDEDVEIKRQQRLVLRSPNGSRWNVTVDDAGALSAVALP